ncbi:MAG: ATP-binding cassette domain-containing protein, partial [Treponema sp.]|nr:ATP-binding cassette domain-containing protein [Treponema sp.]
MNEIAVSMKNISMLFPGVKALDNVSFDIKKGELHAIIGENGAGKYGLYEDEAAREAMRVLFNT